MHDKRRRLGGGLLLVVASWIALEFSSWTIGKVLDVSLNTLISIDVAQIHWRWLMPIGLVVVALALLFWPNEKQLKESPSIGFDDLAWEAKGIIQRIDYHRTADWYRRDSLENLVDLARDCLSLLATFQKGGLEVPKFDTSSAEKICVGMREYFARLFPLMRDGHDAEAREAAQNGARYSETLANSFDPQDWVNRKV